MKIVLAPNTFKESLAAPDVCKAMEKGIRAAGFSGEIKSVPMADGGDGTMDALVAATGGEIRSMTATDPLGRPVEATFGLLGGGNAAVVEMAQASGLWRLTLEERNPSLTSTHGTGDLIRAALDAGATTIVVGIGGSATVEGGAGMAESLGYRFLDSSNKPIRPTGGNLRDIRAIDASGVDAAIRGARFRVACDVDNPLLGTHGAATVYGPQKGATPEMIDLLEEGLSNLARLWEHDLDVQVKDTPGAGAAGGLGAGLVAFCRAEIVPGFDLIAELSGLDNALEGADLVFTGEGRVDQSTGYGKVPAGVARRAHAKSIPVVCLAGEVIGDVSDLHQIGITAILPIVPGPTDLQTSIQEAAGLLSRATEQVMRLRMA
ncbi:MAG: glycerate kinase [bacterium]